MNKSHKKKLLLNCGGGGGDVGCTVLEISKQRGNLQALGPTAWLSGGS